VLAREEFCVAADQALCSSIVLNGNGPTCTEHPLGTCAYTAPVEPANTTCVAVAAGNCSAVNATVEGEEACLTAGDCVYTAADAETGVPAECVAADAASCLGAIVNQTNLTLSYLEDACAGAGNCSFSPAVEEVIEKCDAVDLAVCESADLNGTASRCTLLGACAHYPEVLPVQEACAATDLAVCAAVDVLSAAADAGARDACTSAAACDFTPGVETSLGVVLSDNDVASVRMYGGPVGQACSGGETIRMPTGVIDFQADGSESPYDCSWRIVCPAGKQASLVMTGLETETQQDMVTIWDGDARMDQLLAELDGNALPALPSFISSGEMIDITFKSDGYAPESAVIAASFKCGYPCCSTATGGYCSYLGEGWVECDGACARCDMWDNADASQTATEGGRRFDTYAIELNSPPQGDITLARKCLWNRHMAFSLRRTGVHRWYSPSLRMTTLWQSLVRPPCLAVTCWMGLVVVSGC
jgi:hypothetical protein